MKNIIKICCAAAMTCGVTLADPAASEDDAYKMSTYYSSIGYTMTPSNINGLGTSGTIVRFIVPVSKGLDYVFLAGIDDSVRDIDLYVYDEVGGMIKEDRRAIRRAGVKFRSSYNGTVQVYLQMTSTSGMGAYSVLVGRRGASRDKHEQAMPDAPLSSDPTLPTTKPE
jgi:hypothetical protein